MRNSQVDFLNDLLAVIKENHWAQQPGDKELVDQKASGLIYLDPLQEA